MNGEATSLNRVHHHRTCCRLEAQDAWTRRQAATNGSAFWSALRLLHTQARLQFRVLPGSGVCLGLIRLGAPLVNCFACTGASSHQVPAGVSLLAHAMLPHASLFVSRRPQMDGMHAGYNARVDQQQQSASQQPGGGTGGTQHLGSGAGGAPSLPHLSMVDFLWMSAVGDLGDLQEALCGSDAQAAGAPGGVVLLGLGCLRHGAHSPSYLVGWEQLWTLTCNNAGLLLLSAPPSRGPPCLPHAPLPQPSRASPHSPPTQPCFLPASCHFPAAKWQRLTPHELAAQLDSAGRCSAVVRVTPDLSDLLLGHSAW